MLKDMKVKLAEYRKKMQKLRSRRDIDGVHRFNEVR